MAYFPQKPNITVTRSPDGAYVVRQNGRWVRELGRMARVEAQMAAARLRVMARQ